MDDNKAGVILEEVRDMFKTLGEGQKVLEGQMEKMEKETNCRFDRLENKVDKLEVKVDRLEKDVKIIKSFVIATDDGLNEHERRITTLEKKTASL